VELLRLLLLEMQGHYSVAGAFAPGEAFDAKEFLLTLGPDNAKFQVIAA
jgi:hypothetical protein